MIRGVKIQHLRGIREGELAELSPLTVLVGPNSAGKSTILDALFIGAFPKTEIAVGMVVKRRQGARQGARWLFWRGDEQGKPVVELASEAGTRRCELSMRNPPNEIVCVIGSSRGGTVFKSDNSFAPIHGGFAVDLPVKDITEVRLVEPREGGVSTPMHDLYSRAVQTGHRAALKDLISAVVPGLQSIEILTEGGEPVLHLVLEDYSVPAGLLGDGVQALLRQSFELAAKPGGVVLLEEPEVHEHPSAIAQTAKAIVTSVRRGVQVILTTHSLELIDALLAEMTGEDVDKLSVYRLKLDGGKLLYSRLSGAMVQLAREDIGDDLR